MKLKVGEDYRIETDSMNYILYKRHVSDPTHRFSSGEAKESWNVVGYFPKLEHLVPFLIEREVKESDIRTLNAVVNTINHAASFLVRVIENEIKEEKK